MTTTTDSHATAELKDLAGWLDDVAHALRKFSAEGIAARVMRDWMRAQAARTDGRALLARLALNEDTAARQARPEAAGGCEFCPAGGGGCSVCLGR